MFVKASRKFEESVGIVKSVPATPPGTFSRHNERAGQHGLRYK